MERPIVMRFNYVRHGPPRFVETMCEFRLAPELRTPCAALIAALFVVMSWFALERHWIDRALSEERSAAARLTHSQEAFAQTKLLRTNVNELLALDKHIREIRLSGAVLSARVVQVGNSMPSKAWLTSIERTGTVVEIQGHAESLDVLRRTLAALIKTNAGAPALVRAVQDDRPPHLIAFTMTLGGR